MHKFIIIFFTALLSTALSQTVYKRNEQFGKTYIYVLNGLPYFYHHAVKQCEMLNATIVQTRTAEEARWLYSTFGLNNHFWIGLMKRYRALPQYWLDGSPVTAPLWVDNMGRISTDDNCIAAVADFDGQWLVSWCGDELRLRWSLICETDEPVVSGSHDDCKREVHELKTQNAQLRDTIAELKTAKAAAMNRVDALTRVMEQLMKRHGN